MAKKKNKKDSYPVNTPIQSNNNSSSDNVNNSEKIVTSETDDKNKEVSKDNFANQKSSETTSSVSETTEQKTINPSSLDTNSSSDNTTHKTIRIHNDKKEEFEGITYDQLFILIIAALMTWVGINRYYMAKGPKIQEDEEVTALEQHDSNFRIRLKDLKSQINLLREEINSKDNIIKVIEAEYSQGIAEKELEVTDLNEKLEKLSNVEKEKDTIEVKYFDLRKDYERKKQKIELVTTALNTLQTKYIEIEKENNKNKEKIESVSKELDTLNSKYTELNNEYNAKNQEADELNKELNELKIKFNNLNLEKNKELEELKSKYNELEKIIKSISVVEDDNDKLNEEKSDTTEK